MLSHPYRDTVEYGERKIHFDVEPASRKTLGISVYPDGAVEVRAPEEASPDAVRAKVRKRVRWIVKQQRDFASFVRAEPPKEYISGETHRYLGRQYRLKIVAVDRRADENVRLVGGYFCVHTTHPENSAHTRRLLGGWYRERAETYLRLRFEAAYAIMAKYGIERPEFSLRLMPRRWGSCTPAQKVLLNPWLILAPTYAIDYVILHELCHLKYPHHGPAFYALVELVLPDWERRKQRLEQVRF